MIIVNEIVWPFDNAPKVHCEVTQRRNYEQANKNASINTRTLGWSFYLTMNHQNESLHLDFGSIWVSICCVPKEKK